MYKTHHTTQHSKISKENSANFTAGDIEKSKDMGRRVIFMPVFKKYAFKQDGKAPVEKKL